MDSEGEQNICQMKQSYNSRALLWPRMAIGIAWWTNALAPIVLRALRSVSSGGDFSNCFGRRTHCGRQAMVSAWPLKSWASSFLVQVGRERPKVTHVEKLEFDTEPRLA